MTAPDSPLPLQGGTPTCAHIRDSLPYMAASLDAEERTARGEQQTQCPACMLWLWPHEVGNATR